MPRKEEAMPCKELLSKEPYKRQEEIRNASSEDRQAGLETIGERSAKETGHQVQLSLERNPSCRTRRRMTPEQRERKLQYQREWYQRVKSAETTEQRERRLERMRAWYNRVKGTETSEERERRLERARLREKRARAAETPKQRESRLERMRLRNKRVRETEQGMARLEKCRKLGAQKKNGKKNSKDVTPVEPAFVIKEEPIEFDPEPSTSAEVVIQNANEDAIREETVIVVKKEPIEFDPEPSASADIVIKDEFVVCSEDYTRSSADVPPSTEPTSHATLSVACLGSRQQPGNGQ